MFPLQFSFQVKGTSEITICLEIKLFTLTFTDFLIGKSSLAVVRQEDSVFDKIIHGRKPSIN